MDRLVLGWGPTASSLLDRLAEKPGRLVVLVGDESRVETIRDGGIDARHVELTDVDAVRTVAGEMDSVIVATDDPRRNRRLTRTARRGYPEAFVLASAGFGPGDDDLAAIRKYADSVLDPTDETATHLLDRSGDGGFRTRKLLSALRQIDGPLAVVTHDNPDPDAIASAVALASITEHAGTDVESCYYGEISHQENRALINLLGFELRTLTEDTDLSEFGGFALVDHSRPGINDGLPADTPIDVVIDHHPPRAPVEARFVDLRSDVGATSTLLAEHLRRLELEPSATLASGLLYGIRTDTDDFSREVSRIDFEAAAGLVERADSAALQRIETPNLTADTFEIVADAIRNRRVDDGVLTSCVGELPDRDALAQAADRLLDMEGIRTVLVFGHTDETVYVSARARGADVDLGEVLREAFGQIGSAGGHAEMAGAQIPVGILIEDRDGDDPDTVIETVVTERFLETLGVEPDRIAAAVYADFLGTDTDPREKQ